MNLKLYRDFSTYEIKDLIKVLHSFKRTIIGLPLLMGLLPLLVLAYIFIPKEYWIMVGAFGLWIIFMALINGCGYSKVIRELKRRLTDEQ